MRLPLEKMSSGKARDMRIARLHSHSPRTRIARRALGTGH